jgi:hypothetical protein
MRFVFTLLAFLLLLRNFTIGSNIQSCFEGAGANIQTGDCEEALALLLEQVGHPSVQKHAHRGTCMAALTVERSTESQINYWQSIFGELFYELRDSARQMITYCIVTHGRCGGQLVFHGVELEVLGPAPMPEVSTQAAGAIHRPRLQVRLPGIIPAPNVSYNSRTSSGSKSSKP